MAPLTHNDNFQQRPHPISSLRDPRPLPRSVRPLFKDYTRLVEADRKAGRLTTETDAIIEQIDLRFGSMRHKNEPATIANLIRQLEQQFSKLNDARNRAGAAQCQN